MCLEIRFFTSADQIHIPYYKVEENVYAASKLTKQLSVRFNMHSWVSGFFIKPVLGRWKELTYCTNTVSC